MIRFLLFLSFLVGADLAHPPYLSAESIAVRHAEGTVHGFLVLRNSDGKIIAAGDLVQVVHGEKVTSRLKFEFKDGSTDDETAVFSQKSHFLLISDHHIQKGPSYPKPIDMAFQVSTGKVTIRFTENGKKKVDTSHVDLPPDLVNGMIIDVLKNIDPKKAVTEVSYLAATPKPRVIKLKLSPHGEETFSVAGEQHKATRFIAKVDLGGLAGLVAPMLGKEPANTNVWVVEGKAPAFVRSEGPLYLSGPIWSIAMTSPVWPESSHAGH